VIRVKEAHHITRRLKELQGREITVGEMNPISFLLMTVVLEIDRAMEILEVCTQTTPGAAETAIQA
jgi:hypothetical protein